MSPGRHGPSPIDEELYADLMGPRREAWATRAAAAPTESKREYATARARTLGRPYAARLAKCATTGTPMKCACPRRREMRWHTCRQHLLCSLCSRTRSLRQGARIRTGLEAALRAGPTRKLTLLTLTLRHTGDLAADRAALAAGWRAFYLALRKRGVKFAYSGAWEVTPGRDGLGHVHAHVACVWPWVDWAMVAEVWTQSCPSSTRIDIRQARSDRQASSPKSAANYLSKYIAKGIEAENFAPDLRSRVLAATYNTRWLFSSRGFFLPFTPCCKDCRTRPVPAIFRWRDWHVDDETRRRCAPDPEPDGGPGGAGCRGDPQLVLSLPEPD